MRRLALAAAVAALAAAAGPAAAQDPGTDIGGAVPSVMELSIDAPDGFGTFPAGPGEHTLAIRTRVTSTDGRVSLSVADGDVASGRRLGRMRGSRSLLSLPLEARAAGSAWQPLDAAIDPVLAAFRQPVANAATAVRLRQRVAAGERPRGPHRKTLLITLSSDAP